MTASFAHLADGTLVTDALAAQRSLAAPGGMTFEVSNPFDGRPLASVASLDGEAAERAVASAGRAFVSWRAELPQRRSRLLRDWYERIVAARGDLAAIMTLEQGKPLAESLGEIDYAASYVEWFAEEAKRLAGESVASPFGDAQTAVWREPVGVAALFTPWNFPAAMLTRKAAAALAAGCTAVAHVSSHAPLSGLALAELARRSGLPRGVFHVLTGDPETIGSVLTTDERVRVASFTGSTEVGRKIAAQCAPFLKRLVMELGGHAPLIVFNDADVERAAEIAVAAKFATSGQDCLAANRIYVEEPLYERFCQTFTRRAAALKVGAGLMPSSEIGPLMHRGAVAKAAAHIEDAVARGARVLLGGAPARDSLLMRPTVLADVSDESLVMRQETFAPVAPITAFNTEAVVVRRANDTEYGLIAYVVTADSGRAFRMARALEYGMVAINRAKITGAPIPFGGVKQSGMGREGSRHGMEAFTDLKYVCFDIN